MERTKDIFYFSKLKTNNDYVKKYNYTNEVRDFIFYIFL
jgi:hypothetical protein